MFSSQAGVCNIFSLCYYDMANSQWVAEYSNYTLFTTAPECKAAVKTLSLGSRFKSNANEAFRVVFDTSSFMTAMAVSAGSSGGSSGGSSSSGGGSSCSSASSGSSSSSSSSGDCERLSVFTSLLLALALPRLLSFHCCLSVN